MKKTLLCVCLVMLSTGYALSQIKSKPAIGISLSNFSKDVPGADTKAQPGLQLGGTFVFGNKLYFEPGIYYCAKSTDFIDKSGSQSINTEAVIKGIRIPAGVGINILGDGTAGFDVHAHGGLSAFFVTGVGDDLEKDDIETSSFGVFAGAGVDIWKLFLDLTYEWSLTNVQKDISNIDVGKHLSFYITAGVKLHFRKK